MQVTAPTWYFHVATLSPDGSSTEQLSADVRTASQERIKRELAALFLEISRVRPLVVFFDDLHWADVSTIDLLNYLTARFEDMRVLLLGTYRPSEMAVAQHSFLQIRSDLQSRGLLTELPLEFLARADVERYLAIEFPDHRFPGELAGLVHARTEGNPLFMVDLLRYLRDRHVIVHDRGPLVAGADARGRRARAARVGAEHDRAQDRAARRARPAAARRRERAGARVRLDDGQRGARDRSGGGRGAARRARSRPRVREAGRRAGVQPTGR